MTSNPALDKLQSFPKGPEKGPFLAYLRQFSSPNQVASNILDLIERDDPYVAPAELFYESPTSNLFEEWEYPVNARSIHEVDEGWLLCLPPGSNRFLTYRETIPNIMKDQIETNFPRLKSELANRPNLFFQGAFYPNEISIRSMEMISLHHGRNYVVRCELKLRGMNEHRTVVLKPTSMAVESRVTSLLDELNRRMSPDLQGRIGPIRAPAIVSVEDTYGILEYLPGSNGVETLPRGINTGSIHALRSTEYPENFPISSEGLIKLADEFAKGAALAFYLRLYDRKPDQLMFHWVNSDKFRISHIDFGRGLKKNFALPWKRYYATRRPPLVFEDYQVPYFEAAASLIFLPHFIPSKLKENYHPFEGALRKRFRRSFVELGYFFKQNAGTIHEYLETLVGQKTQFNESEVHSVKVTRSDVEEISENLRSFDPSPEDVCESIISLACHERQGGAPTESVHKEQEDTIYDRGVRSGKTSHRLMDQTDKEPAYHLKDYKRGGKVYYDPEDQLLRVDFGPSPRTVIDYVYWRYSPHLAEFFESFSDIDPQTRAVVKLTGESKITIPPSLVRRDVKFPRDALDEVRQVARGFAPPEHLKNYLDQYRDWLTKNPESDFIDRETKRQHFIFETSMDGKEILQWYARTTNDDGPVARSLGEVIQHLLSNPHYLTDKDPFKSINNLVVNLGHKHEFSSPLKADDFSNSWKRTGLFKESQEIYNEVLSAGYFESPPPQPLSHVKILLDLTDRVLTRLDLNSERDSLLRSAVLLHDLCTVNEDFTSLFMNPNNRLDRPIYESLLGRHAELSVKTLHSFRESNRISPPDSVDQKRLTHLLRHHHQYWRDHVDLPSEDDRVLYELLHLLDNFAVFSDQTRPGYWNKGYRSLTELAPQWLDVQYKNGRVSERIYSKIKTLLKDEQDQLDRIGTESRRFIVLHNALKLASLLNNGLSPQNPHMVRELEKRHGENLIKELWSRIIETNLPVGEKVRILRRLDELAPLFSGEEPSSYRFLNASPLPVQRTVVRVTSLLKDGYKVILIGLFPRVTKSFERLLENGDSIERERLNNVVAVAGKRRLQFIHHSYPYEAQFEQPLHKIIQQYRSRHSPDQSLCFIPFKEFFRSYSPVEDPSSRVRGLEKASSVEEHTVPEQVQYEARRFNNRFSADHHLDRLENERFRRIILNNFSNREVLYFYWQTLPGYPGTRQALRETVGALRENPNYLSERTSRYDIHELVRSLSQIHFFKDKDPRSHRKLSQRLNELNVRNHEPYFQLLDELGSDLNFFKNTLIESLNYLDLLKDDGSTEPCELYLMLSAGLIGTNSTWRDYLLSAEDISYNRILRRQLVSDSTNLSERILKSERLASLPDSVSEKIKKIMKPPLGEQYTLIQTALYLGLSADFSRVENWERGHRQIHERDFEYFTKSLEQSLNKSFKKNAFNNVIKSIKNKKEVLLERMNQQAENTYAYVYLFNTLTFASKLRYGLFPGRVNNLDNIRELYGTKLVSRLMNGIIESDLSALESLKVVRKIRYLASAFTRLNSPPRTLNLLNLDRSGTWSLPGKALDDDVLFVLSGELTNARIFWESIRRSDPEFANRCYCLIGEEYPLLIKETTLSSTGNLREAVRTYRDNVSRSGRHLLIPAENLFEPLCSTKKTDGRLPIDDPHAFYLKAWMSLFKTPSGLIRPHPN